MHAALSSLPTLALSLVPEGLPSAWQFLLFGVLSVLIFGVAKAGFGGVAAVSTPLMVYACNGQSLLAAAIMLPLLILTDYATLVIWWRRWSLRQMLALLPGTLLGLAAGTGLLWWLLRLDMAHPGRRDVANAGMALAIGLIALGFVVLQVLRTRRGLSGPYRPTAWHAWGFGATAGLTSLVSHAAGPVVTMYLLPQQMPKARFVGTMVVFFWTLNQVKLIPYWALSLLNAPSLGASLALLPAVGAGVLLGVFLHKRVSQVWFNRVIHIVLALVGVHLSVSSTLKLWHLLGV